MLKMSNNLQKSFLFILGLHILRSSAQESEDAEESEGTS